MASLGHIAFYDGQAQFFHELVEPRGGMTPPVRVKSADPDCFIVFVVYGSVSRPVSTLFRRIDKATSYQQFFSSLW